MFTNCANSTVNINGVWLIDVLTTGMYITAKQAKHLVTVLMETKLDL